MRGVDGTVELPEVAHRREVLHGAERADGVYAGDNQDGNRAVRAMQPRQVSNVGVGVGVVASGDAYVWPKERSVMRQRPVASALERGIGGDELLDARRGSGF